MNETLGTRVREVVGTTIGVDSQQIGPEDSAQTLPGWTSLAHLRLLANLEQAFGLRFTVHEMAAMSSLQAIEQVLVTKGID